MYIKEFFYSFQGEGVYVGQPQIFIRFYGCNIHCAYCDEPDFEKDKVSRSMEWVQSQLTNVAGKPLHSVSLTGGEPLLHVSAIKKLLPILPAPAYLETNGTLPDRLKDVIDDITYFAVDYKPGFESEFESFMALLKDKPNVFVKYILTKDFPKQDLEFLSGVLSRYPNVPFILQPVTPFALVSEKCSPDDVFRAYDICSRRISDVRVIPQTHKFVGLL